MAPVYDDVLYAFGMRVWIGEVCVIGQLRVIQYDHVGGETNGNAASIVGQDIVCRGGTGLRHGALERDGSEIADVVR